MEREEKCRLSVSKWELARKCNNAAEFSTAFTEDCRPFVLRDLIEQVCKDLRNGVDLSTVHEPYFNYLAARYKDSWFALSWQREKAAYHDVALIERFLDFFKKFNAKVVETGRECTVEFDNVVLTQKVDLIYESNGKYYAGLIHTGKTSKSLGGRFRTTDIREDVAGMVVKSALENDYPKISVCNFYLKTDADKGSKIGEFVVDKTKSSQYFCVEYEKYYHEGVFDADGFKDAIKASMAEPVKKNCAYCKYQTVCSGETVFAEIERTNGADKGDLSSHFKSVVSFNQSQLEGIRKEGPTLIVAGPGSGKTATLVGKIRYLIEEKDVPAPFILMLSFTNDAVKEIKERCSIFCEEEDMPNIYTINGLAYHILTEQRAAANLPKQPILTDIELKNMILAELMLYEEMDGIDIQKEDYFSKTGVLQKITRLYKDYVKEGEEEFFAPNRHTECGGTVLEFFHTLDEIIAQREYITFDEQISLCAKFLKENPEKLKIYQSIFQYILVDEYQDINAEQAELIYMLAKPQNNLTVVGDVDQNIYSFRGADSSIMLAFREKFGVNAIVLNENYRSSSGIVEATSKIIRLEQEERIETNMKAVNSSSSGKPKFVQRNDPAAVDIIIKRCLDMGFSLDDIAILARTNAELGTLKDALSYPCILAKNYIVKNALFRFLNAALSYVIAGRTRGLYELFILFGLKEIAVSFGGKPEHLINVLKETDKHLDLPRSTKDNVKQLNYILDGIRESYIESLDLDNGSFDFFFDSFCADLGISEASPFVAGIQSLVDLYRVKTVEDFYLRSNELIDFQDETKLGIEGCANNILLLTMHEAKGLEFPVVILMDDGKTNFMESPEGVRLLYVGASRPQKDCYYMSKRYLPMFDDIFERIAI